MPILKFENFLDEDLYEESIKTAEYLLTLGNNTFSTNRWWDFCIRKDSYPVFVHNINQESDLYRNIRKTIEEKTKSIIQDDNIMLYYWTRHSYIPWHNDGIKYKGAITIYLNRDWHSDYGGYFLYEEQDEIKAVLPKRNLGVMQYGGLSHSTTPVNFDGDIRFTIQAFLRDEE
jgi:Rps23 Pro-64 3,4-dihydroxylase Tpa1-like proline 4-hydroxylase